VFHSVMINSMSRLIRSACVFTPASESNFRAARHIGSWIMSSSGLLSALPGTNVVPPSSEYSTTLEVQYLDQIRLRQGARRVPHVPRFLSAFAAYPV